MASVPPGWDGRLSVECVLAGQGIDPRAVSAMMPALREAAARALPRGLALVEPFAATQLIAICSRDESGVVLEDGTRLEGEEPIRRLAGATRALLCACTIGPGIDREVAALFPEDPVLALALDGLGCAALEALAAAIRQDAREAARRDGCEVTAALAPGVEGWPLAHGQRQIFAALGPLERLRLGESGQMWPVKSVSFVAGVGPHVKRHESEECEGCGARERCRWRTARRKIAEG